jgi:hypothetical protein
MIRENLKVAQSRLKSYADKRRRNLSFKIGDFVYLKVSLRRGTHRFKVKWMLAPRYVGPFTIVDHKGEVAYQVELPPQLLDMHDVFHALLLKKCLWVLEEQLPMEELDQWRFWIWQNQWLAVWSSRCAKFNGVTILKMKLHGSMKKSSE